MHHFTRSAGRSLLKSTLVIASIIFTVNSSPAQSINGVNTTGNDGNETIQGTIHFPAGRKTGFQPVIKVRGDSSPIEFKALANPDGSFSFTRLRPDSYTVTVEGGPEFENAREQVLIGNSGPVPAQGNPAQYAHPLVYQLEIYLQPKRTVGLNVNSETARAQMAKLPDQTRTVFLKAMDSAAQGESANAIEQLTTVLSQSPNFEMAYTAIGLQYLKMGNAGKAAESFAAALKLDANDFEARLNYGFALVSLQQFPAAEEQLRLALKRDSSSASGHYYLGLALMKQKNYDGAEGEFKTAISLSSDGIAPAHKYLGAIYWDKKEYRAAAAELERYLVLDPKATDAAKIRQTIDDLHAKR